MLLSEAEFPGGEGVILSTSEWRLLQRLGLGERLKRDTHRSVKGFVVSIAVFVAGISVGISVTVPVLIAGGTHSHSYVKVLCPSGIYI